MLSNVSCSCLSISPNGIPVLSVTLFWTVFFVMRPCCPFSFQNKSVSFARSRARSGRGVWLLKRDEYSTIALIAGYVNRTCLCSISLKWSRMISSDSSFVGSLMVILLLDLRMRAPCVSSRLMACGVVMLTRRNVGRSRYCERIAVMFVWLFVST